jgi:hypothetical protein
MKTGVVCQAEKTPMCAPGPFPYSFYQEGLHRRTLFSIAWTPNEFNQSINQPGPRDPLECNISNLTQDFLFSQPSGFPSVEGFCKKREKEGTSGEGKDNDGWNDLRYASQMHLYLFLLFPRPSFICVPGFHKQLHQPRYRKDFHQDGLLINNDQPFKILFNHRPTTHNSIFLAFTFSNKFHEHGNSDTAFAPPHNRIFCQVLRLSASDLTEDLISNLLFSQI